MIAVSDTGPIIGLAKANRLSLLKNLFEKVLIPPTDEGNLMVQPKHNELSAWLLPTLHLLEDVQEVLGLAQVTNRALTKHAHL